MTTTTRWAVPGGRVLLAAGAPRAEWLAERRNGIGGSDVAAVLGISDSPVKAWLIKTGQIADDADNDAMMWGRLLEPVVARWWSAEHGIEIRRCGLVASRADPIIRATPDRLTADGGILEVKTTGWRMAHLWADDQVPDDAELQSQQQMAATGRQPVHVVALVDGRSPQLRTIYRDDGLIANMMKLERQWWESYVVAGQCPPLDGSVRTSDAVKAWWPGRADEVTIEASRELLDAFAQLRAAKAVTKEAEARQRRADTEVRALLRDATYVVDDILAETPRELATCKANGQFSEKAFRAAHPDVAAAFVETVERVDRRALADAHPDLYAQFRARVLRVKATTTTKDGDHDG